MRLLWVCVAFGLGVSLTFYYQQTVFGWLLAPARGHLSATGQPVFTSPTEMMGVAIHLALMGGVVVAFPVLIYHVTRFASPLLPKQYRRSIAIFVPAAFVFYLTGVAFAYFVLLPTSLGFLLGFGGGVAAPMIRISEYMDLVQAMLLWLGVVFELPLVMFVLVKLRLVSRKRLVKLRKYVPWVAIILSAIITPTFDVVNQTLVAVPMILLWEVGLMLAWLARPKAASAS